MESMALAALSPPMPVRRTVTSFGPMLALKRSNSRRRSQFSNSYGTKGWRDDHGENSALMAKVTRICMMLQIFRESMMLDESSKLQLCYLAKRSGQPNL